jgi:dipeptidyl aminopeptidase/acylaminoacyl peptidase
VSRMRVLAVRCLAALLYWVCATCVAHAMSLSDLEKLSGPSGVTVNGAPDGSMLALEWNGEVLLVDLRARRVVKDLGPGFGAGWAPSSRKLAFYSKRSGTLQLWVWRRRSDRSRQLTRDAGGLDIDPTTRVAGSVLDAFPISWSPDGSLLAFASRLPLVKQGAPHRLGTGHAKSIPEAPIVLTNSSPLGLTLKGVLVHPGFGYGGVYYSDDGVTMRTRGGEDSETQIRVVDVDTATGRWITGGADSHFDPVWSPDGGYIACVSVPGAGMAIRTGETQIEVIAQPSGAVRIVTSGTGVKASPVWMAPASTLAFMQRNTTFAWPRIYATTTVERPQASVGISALNGIDRRIGRLVWSPAAKEFLAAYRDGVSSPLARIPLHSPMVVLTRAPYPVGVYDFTTFNRGAVAWVQADPQDLWTVRYLGRGAHEPIVLLHLSRVPRAGDLGRAEVVSWQNRSGEELEGTILLPPHFSRAVRYPLIVDAYPLIGGSSWTSPMLGNYGWAAAGYVVFRPSPPAPTVWFDSWTTEASSTIAKGPKGWAVTVDDVMSGVDHLVAEGLVDPNRMCLYGWSNGGGVVDYLVTRVHRFRCAVSVEPAFADVVRLFLLSPEDMVSWLNGGKQLDTGLAGYIALSSVFHLSSVKTPMLLADGDEDGDFLLNSIEVYDQLRQLGKPVTLVRYPDQGHGFSGNAMSDFWGREMAFFARYLRPSQGLGGTTASSAGERVVGARSEIQERAHISAAIHAASGLH